MKYDFDSVIERRNSGSSKYDYAKAAGKPLDLLPFWVADMDFQIPQPVIDAMVERTKHGIFGYGEPREDYLDPIVGWYKKYFGWEPKKEWMVFTPGIVFAVSMAIRTCTKPGEAVLIQRPVYYPFTNMILENDRKLVNNPLIYKDGRYTLDLADFEKKIVEEDVKLFILCSPHNPVGRVWTPEELIAMGDICKKHGVLVVSDEIHEDFVFEGHKHHVFINLKEEYKDFTITCTAPSKTFNVAGLQLSHIWIPNEEIRNKFKKVLYSTGYEEPSVYGTTAAFAAYSEGREWLDQLKEYLAGNVDFVRSYLAEHLPAVKLVEPEGTYLLWLDCSALPYDTAERQRRIEEQAKLWLDTGAMFGPEGEAFERVNIACPRVTLEEGMKRFCEALK